MEKEVYYVEIVNGKVRRPRIDPNPVISSYRKATELEIKSAKESFEAGECDHTLFYDKKGWMYDERCCKLCDAGIALI